MRTWMQSCYKVFWELISSSQRSCTSILRMLNDEDNAPKHKSYLVRTWLFNNGIQCIDFPPYSPDLNPIENLWADLARRVEEFQCETMEELQDIVAEEWKKTSKELLRTLVHS